MIMSLTIKSSGGKLNVLQSQIGVSIPFDGDPAINSTPTNKYIGVWDTGATNSVITEKVAKELDLKPIGIKEVHTASGSDFQNQYLINIVLPNGVGIRNVLVTEGKLNQIDLLIGMDIITLGDFAITNLGGQTTMTFCMPSCHTFDFVQEYPSGIKQSRTERRKAERAARKIK